MRLSPEQSALPKRITDTAVSLHSLARTLDIRDGLDVTALPNPIRAAEWARVIRNAEVLLLSYHQLLVLGNVRPRSGKLGRVMEGGA